MVRVLGGVGLLVWAQGYVPRERLVDMERLRLEVRFAPEKGIVYGLATHVFRPLRPGVDSLVLDAVDLTIEEVRFHGQPVPFQNTGKELIVRFPAALPLERSDSISVRYMATPRKGLYFIGWKDPTGRARKQIWTQGQSTD
ncbi:MAG: hypothetical protein D6750_11000, partial [Bacteroidetes bacterium]